MTMTLTGTTSELGALLARHRSTTATGAAHINVAGQQANTLLHDGHAWQDFARTTLAATRRALRSVETNRVPFLVHASFAFVHAVEEGSPLKKPLKSMVDAILECEAMVLSAPVPACVVRLGYLYGPHSADLRAYRKAFRLGRPYWSGPSRACQYGLHQSDAVAALIAAGKKRNASRTLYAVAGPPVPFERFMDAFAHRVGRRNPLHLPLLSRPLAHVIIREEHMQQTALSMPPGVPTPRVPGWKPEFADYRKGLDQVIESWRD
jgi:nucleoside-diphosphate-sugar epimerase